MSHRIFIAFSISDLLGKKINEWKKNFRKKSPATYKHIRWVKEKNLHITLIPPFQASGVELRSISDIIKKVVGSFSQFDVSFTNISYGPNSFNPRLIWITGNAPERILKLRNALNDNLLKLNCLRKFNFGNLENDFLLHLTIARFNQFDFKYFNIKKVDEKFEFKENLNEVIFFESFLRKEGAEYKVLQSVQLKT